MKQWDLSGEVKEWLPTQWPAWNYPNRMANKGEIGWKRRDVNGEKIQVSARKLGNRWLFRIRAQKFDNWTDYENPDLEDWIELLDSVRRRIQRNLIPEIEEDRLISTIKEHYPEAKP